jgi:hypothetical protein
MGAAVDVSSRCGADHPIPERRTTARLAGGDFGAECPELIRPEEPLIILDSSIGEGRVWWATLHGSSGFVFASCVGATLASPYDPANAWAAKPWPGLPKGPQSSPRSHVKASPSSTWGGALALRLAGARVKCVMCRGGSLFKISFTARCPRHATPSIPYALHHRRVGCARWLHQILSIGSLELGKARLSIIDPVGSRTYGIPAPPPPPPPPPPTPPRDTFHPRPAAAPSKGSETATLHGLMKRSRENQWHPHYGVIRVKASLFVDYKIA